jgi:hypothetical protein
LPFLDYEQAARVAELLKPIALSYAENPDPFTSSEYYPPPNADKELTVMYFLAMVAIDHRLSRPGRPYEARIGGRLYHGADLLYRLGMLMFERNPEFFSADSLAKLRAEDVKAWLCVGNVCPPDPEVRAELLRDLGLKLLEFYGGSGVRLLREAHGKLHTWDPLSPGLAELLKCFKAYSDPVEKKIMLLAKFLERRQLIKFEDTWNKRVPVDNHVTRIALRLGIVRLERELEVKVRRGIEFKPWEDVLLRTVVREAWHEVAVRTGVDDFILDDILWSMGRKVCTYARPNCRRCIGHPICGDGRCLLGAVCPTALNVVEPLNEHTFINTWWY